VDIFSIFGNIVFDIWSIILFLLGFFVSRYTQSKREKCQTSMDLSTRSESLIEKLDLKYKVFAIALNKFSKKKNQNINDFCEISITGESYIEQVRIICTAILNNTLDAAATKNNILSKIRDVAMITLPKYYDTLKYIAKRKGFQYNGEIKKEQNKCIIKVLYKYYSKKEINGIIKDWK